MSDYKYVTYSESLNLKLPNKVAEYTIANLHFVVYDKKDIPNRFIRFCQKHILGIKWEIYKTYTTNMTDKFIV